jgi:3-hydroxyisobutyrate dehydrogenase
MRLANLTLEEMTEALNRGWGNRDAWSMMQLQTERAGVDMTVDPARIEALLNAEKAKRENVTSVVS